MIERHAIDFFQIGHYFLTNCPVKIDDMVELDLPETFSFLGIDQDEAAQLLGVSTRTLRRWIEGEEIPGPAKAALTAWRQLHARHLAWKPDSIAVFEDDQDQIERARKHAEDVAGIIQRVEARGGPKNPWSVNLAKCTATFGPFEVGFYKLQNGGFSFSSYRRKDSSPDLTRDRPYLEDAAYSIADAFSKAGAGELALKAVAQYVRRHSTVFVVDGPHSLPTAERRRRQREIEAIADKLDALAVEAGNAGVSYLQFEALLHELHVLGFYPTIELVSDVAKATI
jgi:hypothetical protein